MENKDQPAFPTQWDTTHNPQSQTDGGLSKREYLSGLAMQGLCASNLRLSADEMACDAIESADALLGALEQSKTEQP